MEDAGLFVQLMWLHRVVGGDSGALVVPFMRVGTYPTRHLAHFCYFSDLVLRTIEASLLFVANLPVSLQGSDSILIVQNDFWRRVSEDSRKRGFIFLFIDQQRFAILVKPSTVRCFL